MLRKEINIYDYVADTGISLVALRNALLSMDVDVTTISLNISLSTHDGVEAAPLTLLGTVLKAIGRFAPQITRLDYSSSRFFDMPVNDFIAMLEQTPDNVRELDLSKVYLKPLIPGPIPKYKLGQILAAIPQQIDDLQLAKNLLNEMTAAILVKDAPEIVRKLMLENAASSSTTTTPMPVAVGVKAASSRTVARTRTLSVDHRNKADYSSYQLSDLRIESFIDMIKRTPRNVIALDLSLIKSLASGSLLIADWLKILAAIPGHVDELQLTHNKLNELGVDDLASLMRGLPDSISILSLERNGLGTLGVDALQHVFNAIPATVSHLNIQSNGLTMTFEEWKRLKSLRTDIVLDYAMNEVEKYDQGHGLLLKALREQFNEMKAGHARSHHTANVDKELIPVMERFFLYTESIDLPETAVMLPDQFKEFCAREDNEMLWERAINSPYSRSYILLVSIWSVGGAVVAKTQPNRNSFFAVDQVEASNEAKSSPERYPRFR